MRRIVILGFMLCLFASSNAQKWDLGISYGRFYAIYKYQDWGSGFNNQANSQYKQFPSFIVNKKNSEKTSMELRTSFMAYTQYTGTRLYSPGFYSDYLGGNISLTYNYSLLRSAKWEGRIKGGVGVGILPDRYEADFLEMLVFPIRDSISRGTIKRDFTFIFPTLVSGIDLNYAMGKKLKICFAFTYQKGFVKVTEYDIYYNDGSGNNDQRAKQWGTGEFYGLQIGLRYGLTNKKNK